MIRKIIEINEEKCNGCGICVNACHEGALGIVNGKAKLLRDDYCDGLGNCLPACPMGAIIFTEREAACYDEKAVEENKKLKMDMSNNISELHNWPVQIKLVPVSAKYFNGANLLIAADCTAFSFKNFQNVFTKGRITLIGCPKLDAVDYTEKLSEILKNNDIKSITVVRMEVPCCGGIEMATKNALQNNAKSIPCDVITISIDGNII